MMAENSIMVDLQRKYRYEVQITVNSSGNSFFVIADEFTPPDKRMEPVMRQNRVLGHMVLTGPVTYGEMTLRTALRVTDDVANNTATLIDALQNLNENVTDTCDVVVMTQANAADGAVKTAYSQSFYACRLTGYKIDALNRHGDDEMLHIEMTLIPRRAELIQGEEITAVQG